MSSIGGLSIDKHSKKLRAQRFAADEAEGPPPLPERKFAHPVKKQDIKRTDPEEKLISLCKRKLANGEGLSEAQVAALSRIGLTVDDIREVAAATRTPIVVPELYLSSSSSASASTGSAKHAHARSTSSSSGSKRERTASMNHDSHASSSETMKSASAAKGKHKSHAAGTSAVASSSSSSSAASSVGHVPLSAAAASGDLDDEDTNGASSAGIHPAKRVKHLCKRLKRIQEKQAEGGELTEAWQRRIATLPVILQELKALKGDGHSIPDWVSKAYDV